ncbi:GntR family transcriptional regulator/MocR family aminotransferase [Algoriphagus iocasae]|uniref:GntR family transcriptional regulator/MocR family aminotransferase n=1 Tax=Algoriphagus iocasae TaxID=1836499 RepID=A0A841MGN9_9BACT|nr:PLP-dependent aminotransferase family protein [Algoriphagus iocasae]MBB6324499.1 GntR family transcriptional regulator/MocR family aminotransferase [Algoriphagus iocasae]
MHLIHWDFLVHLEFSGTQPLYLQLAGAIREKITSHKLPAGLKVPSSRELSAMVHLGRKTILHALDSLVASGHLYSAERKGYFVSDISAPDSNDLNTGLLYQDISTDLPSGRLKSEGELARLYRRHYLKSVNRDYSQLIHTDSFRPFLKSLGNYLNRTRGLSLSQGEFTYGFGNYILLLMVLHALFPHGGRAVIGEPFNPSIVRTFINSGFHLDFIPVTPEGMDTDALEERLLKEVPDVLWLEALGHYPTGAVMSGQRRDHLFRLMQQYSFRVIEGNYESDFTFSGIKNSFLADFPESGTVQLSYLSRLIPTFQLTAIVAAPPELIHRLTQLLQHERNVVFEHAVHSFLSEELLIKLVLRSQKKYHSKLRRIVESSGRQQQLYHSGTGLSLWYEFPHAIDYVKLDQKLKVKGLFMRHIKDYYYGAPPENMLRIGLGKLPVRTITQILKMAHRYKK